MSVRSRDEWLFGSYTDTIIKDKKCLINHYVRTMLNRTQQMFEWTELPETIPSRDLELLLQCNGNGTVARVDDKLYVFRGGLGGEPNPYYLPTISVVANPALKLSKTYKIDEDCVIIKNDSLYDGLLPMFNKYASLLAECDISIRFGLVNHRILALIVANTDKAKKEAEKYLTDIETGEKLGILAGDDFVEDVVKTQQYGTSQNNSIKDLIEMKQYLIGSWFSEIGLNAVYNMKREAISDSEAYQGEETLMPLIDDMLACRKEACKKINEMFGTNIDVKLSSSWKLQRYEKQLEDDVMEAQAKDIINNSQVEVSTDETGADNI